MEIALVLSMKNFLLIMSNAALLDLIVLQI